MVLFRKNNLQLNKKASSQISERVLNTILASITNCLVIDATPTPRKRTTEVLNVLNKKDSFAEVTGNIDCHTKTFKKQIGEYDLQN